MRRLARPIGQCSERSERLSHCGRGMGSLFATFGALFHFVIANGWWTLPALSFLFSIPLVVLVEIPMERWRQKRIALAVRSASGTPRYAIR